MSARTYWHCAAIVSTAGEESLLRALLRYRFHTDRQRVGDPRFANLVSSRTERGTHLPILDLDFDHRYVPSTTPGHAHLYLNVELPRWRWVLLMLALRLGGVIEHGTLIWSLRRMGNFVRVEGRQKQEHEYSKVPETAPDYFRRG